MDAQYRPLKDLVYDYISQRIADGSLEADDRVPEPMICEALDVSRTPVREALIQLATEGYLESVPRKGFRVRGVDPESAVEIYQVIGPLDGEVAYLACPNLTDEDFRQMRFLISSMTLSLDSGLLDRYDGAQKEFHRTYREKCGNQRLRTLLTEQERTFMKRGYESVSDDETRRLLETSNAEHARILELFEAGDRAGVRDFVRDVHWDTTNAPYSVW